MHRREALKALVAMPAVTRISVAQVKPDDVIVIECPGPISGMTAAHIRDVVEQAFPGQKVLVLADGMQMKVLERQVIPPE